MGKWSRYFFCAKTKEEGNLALFWQQCDRQPEKRSFLYQTQSIHWFVVLPCSPPCVVCPNLIDADVFPHTEKKWFLFQIFMDSDSAETPRKYKFLFFFSLFPSCPGARFRSVRMHQLCFFVKLDCLLPNPPFLSFFFRNCKLPPTPILHHRPISPPLLNRWYKFKIWTADHF